MTTPRANVLIEQRKADREAEELAQDMEAGAAEWDALADGAYSDAPLSFCMRLRSMGGNARQTARNLRAMMAHRTKGTVQ